jgi:hypothetical protein
MAESEEKNLSGWYLLVVTLGATLVAFALIAWDVKLDKDKLEAEGEKKLEFCRLDVQAAIDNWSKIAEGAKAERDECIKESAACETELRLCKNDLHESKTGFMGKSSVESRAWTLKKSVDWFIAEATAYEQEKQRHCKKED